MRIFEYFHVESHLWSFRKKEFVEEFCMITQQSNKNSVWNATFDSSLLKLYNSRFFWFSEDLRIVVESIEKVVFTKRRQTEGLGDDSSNVTIPSIMNVEGTQLSFLYIICMLKWIFFYNCKDWWII